MYVCMMIDDLRLSYATVILQKKIFVVYWCWSKKWDEVDTELICWYVFSAVHIILLPSQKPPSSYSLLKFVYVTSRLRHSLVGHPHPPPPAPPRKILNWPTYIFSKGLWSRLATIVHLANDLSLYAMKLEKLLLNYKTTASCQANMSSKASFQTFQTTKLNLEKLLG